MNFVDTTLTKEYDLKRKNHLILDMILNPPLYI